VVVPAAIVPTTAKELSRPRYEQHNINMGESTEKPPEKKRSMDAKKEKQLEISTTVRENHAAPREGSKDVLEDLADAHVVPREESHVVPEDLADAHVEYRVVLQEESKDAHVVVKNKSYKLINIEQ
jgi:hypothetical protein